MRRRWLVAAAALFAVGGVGLVATLYSALADIARHVGDEAARRAVNEVESSPAPRDPNTGVVVLPAQ